MATITTASPPTTADVASQVLANMAALSGVASDYNIGSQVRTQAESLGSVIEMQGIWTQDTAFQALVYSAMSLFGIAPSGAIPASGTVNFQTIASGSGPAASQNVAIPSGTIVATVGGVQFQTSAALLLAAGSSGIAGPVAAMLGGFAGNVPAGSIVQIINSPPYPLYVTNVNPTAGGIDSETFSQTLARFTALRGSIGLSSPGAIADAAIGVMASGTGETVLYSTTFEPWLAAGSGAGSGTAGWSLYIDNGTGGASSDLIAAVGSFLNGGMVSGATNASAAQGVGFRDAGVPYNIYAVTPTTALVTVSGSVGTVSNSAVTNAISGAVLDYFTLAFGAPAELPQISASAANAAVGLLTALAVTLTVSGSSTPLTILTPPVTGRVILGGVTVNLTGGSA